eukprot:scaffold761_cov153-Amphora_coffeaeformis.AAC.2
MMRPLLWMALLALTANGFFTPNTHRSSLKKLSSSSSSSSSCVRLQSISIKVSDLERQLDKCRSAREATRILDQALSKEEDSDCLYKSVSIPVGASTKGISDGDLAIQTRLANKKYRIMDLIELSGDRDADRASLAALCLLVASTGSAVVANQKLPGPEIFRFIVVWLFSFAPLAFAGYGIAAPEKLQTTLVSIQRNFFPAYRRRMLQHEAGHLLMAHLVGYPIAGYRANAVKNAVELYPLQDASRGEDMARMLGFDGSRRQEQATVGAMRQPEDVPFFSDEGRGALLLEQQSVFRKDKNYTDNPFLRLSSLEEPSGVWPYRGFDEATLDKLTVVALGGVCAEILAFGNAEGGLADISLLKQIYLSSEDDMTEREVTNRIRFGLGFTITQLRRHLGVLDVLAETMEQDGSVAECIAAMEACESISGQDGIMGDYELTRRQKFRDEGTNWVEKVFLGNDRNIDTDENRMVEGKGGGYEKQTFRLTGDDPLYAALAVAVGFLVWASSGGLSLH